LVTRGEQFRASGNCQVTERLIGGTPGAFQLRHDRMFGSGAFQLEQAKRRIGGGIR
jgi:hypothetical protein